MRNDKPITDFQKFSLSTDIFLNKKNILAPFFSQFINYLIPFFLLITLFKLMDETNVGYFVSCQSFFLFILIVLDFGLSWEGVKSIVQQKTINRKIVVASELLSFQYSLLVIIYLLLILFGSYLIHDYLILFVSFIMITFGNYMTPIWIYHGFRIFFQYTVIRFLMLVLLSIFFIIFSKNMSWMIAIFFFSLSYFCSGIISFLFLKKKYHFNFFKFNIKTLKDKLNFQKWLFIGRFSSSLYTVIIPFLLIYFVPVNAIAYFSIAEKFKNILQGIFTPIHQLLLISFSELHSTSIKKYNFFLKKVFFIYMVSTFILTILAIIFSSDFIKIFNVTQNRSLDLLMLISPVLFFIVSITNFIGFHIMIPKNFYLEFGLSIFFPCVTGLFAFYFLTSSLGIVGSSISVLVTEFLVLVLMLFFVTKRLKN